MAWPRPPMVHSDPPSAAPRAPVNGGSASAPQAEDWLTPWVVNSSLQRYWNAVRSRWWLVIVTAALAGGVAMLYVAHATKLYTAEADLLVSPVRSSDTALLGLGLINSSVDPTRAAQTVSSLVRSYDVAGEAQRTLRTAHGPRSLLSEVTVSPSGQSNVVAVKATTPDPTFSRRLADAFAQAAITLRTEHIHAVVKQLLPSLIAGSRGLAPDNPLVTEVAQLQELLVAPDPTLQLISHAQQPTSPSSPRPLLSLVVALIGGAVLGVVGAFVLHMADPRLRRLSTLREN